VTFSNTHIDDTFLLGIIKYIGSKRVSVGDIILLLQLKFLVTEITPMRGFGLPCDDVDMPGLGTVFAFGDMESWKQEEMA
jgi:hypothetical protein